MEINIQADQDVTVVEIVGEVTANTAPDAQQKLVPLVQPGLRLMLDLSKVPFMSSAGLRLLLLLYRNIIGAGGKVVLVGISEDLVNTMSVTGFLQFFKYYPTREAGRAALMEN
jgi:anti-sigma B factor antagonist